MSLARIERLLADLQRRPPWAPLTGQELAHRVSPIVRQWATRAYLAGQSVLVNNVEFVPDETWLAFGDSCCMPEPGSQPDQALGRRELADFGMSLEVVHGCRIRVAAQDLL